MTSYNPQPPYGQPPAMYPPGAGPPPPQGVFPPFQPQGPGAPPQFGGPPVYNMPPQRPPGPPPLPGVAVPQQGPPLVPHGVPQGPTPVVPPPHMFGAPRSVGGGASFLPPGPPQPGLSPPTQPHSQPGPGFMPRPPPVGPPPVGPPPVGGMYPPPPPGSGPLSASGFPGPHGAFPGPQVMPGPPPMGGYDPYAAQRMMDQFESLTMGGGGVGPGMVEQADVAAFPRPVGSFRAKATAFQPPVDPGNCHPDNMRLTVNGIPNSTALKARWPLPIGLVVHPMSDDVHNRPVPLVPLGPAGIVRCRRCRTYMNPFMQWTDGGRRYKCNVCTLVNEVPLEYFSTVDQTGRRRDAEDRPELSKGTVEYVAPAEYMVRPPMPPVYFFVLDVSYPAVASGMVTVAASTIKSCLDKLPGDERTLVGFLTFDSSLHFYNLKAGLSQPQMLVVGELDEPFVPLPDELLVNLKESRSVVDALLDALPNNFAQNTVVESAAGPALQAAFLVMSHVGGKMLVFQCSSPSLGVGKVKNRENATLYNTEREATLRNAEDPFFKRFGPECSRVQITVDLFAMGSQYMDLASLVTIPRYTCGQVYYYPGFNAARDGAKFHHELVRNLTRATAWEAVMRIRCSKGLRISSFHGHFFNRSSDLLALPTCDPDKVFAVQVSHEETVATGTMGYVQCALLYTSSNGERRIRVHTLAVPIVADLMDMFKTVDCAGTVSLLARLGIEKSLSARLEDTRQAIQGKVTQALKEFRLMHAGHLRAHNKMVYPETLKYLMIWSLGLMKTTALRGGGKEVGADERMAAGHEMMAVSTDVLLKMCYPMCYPVSDMAGTWGQEGEGGKVILPETIPLSLAFMRETGVYLLDNGRTFIFWIGRMAPAEWLAEAFALEPSALPADPSQLSVEPARPTPLSKRLNNLLAELRRQTPSTYQQSFVIRQGTPLEAHVISTFVEDRAPGSMSYLDYMLLLHKAIMSK